MAKPPPLPPTTADFPSPSAPRRVVPKPGGPEAAGRFRLQGEIGHGGMGSVLLGRDPELNRDLAVKVLLERHRDRPELVERFLEEAQVESQLQHPGIVPVHEVGRLPDGRPFFAMKLVQGRTLADLLAERKSRADGLAFFLGVFEQVCQTLAYVHARGVIHRDLKPANVMVGSFGEVQVMDWGIAKVLKRTLAPDSDAATLVLVKTRRSESEEWQSKDGAVLGTPAYMAPEQARGEVEALDERADVFGLGAILCEVLTGNPPYVCPPNKAITTMAASADLAGAFARLDRCGADAELIALTRECLAADREARPRNAGDVTMRIMAYRAGVESRLRQAELERAAAQARAEEAAAKAIAERRSRRLTLALTGAGLVILLLAGGVTWWVRQAQQDRLAEKVRQEEEMRRATQDDLLRAAVLQGDQKWGEALAVVERTEARLPENAPDDLRRRVRDTRADLALVTQLEQIRSTWTLIRGVNLDFAGANRAYAEAFRTRYGLDADRDDVAEFARRLAESPVRDSLLAALDDWAFVRDVLDDKKGRNHLLLIAGTVDTTDRWRTRLREALAANDPGAIRDVARRVPVDDLAPATVILLDSILTRIGDRKAAFDLLEHAREKHPSDFWINLRLAQHHWLARPPRLEEAARFFHIALVLRPDHVGIMNDLGNALKDQGKFPEAMALYRKAIRLRPDDIYPRLNLSEALRVQGKLQEAEREARRAVDVKSGHPLPHWNLAGMLFYQGRYADAEAEYRLALRLLGDVPDPVTAADIHYGLGVLLHEQDRTREAEDELREALRVQPRLGTACYRLGGVLTDQGRWPEAAAMYQKALQYEGEQGLTYLNLGHCLIRLGRTDEGVKLVRRGHELGQKEKDWNQPSAELLRYAERLAELGGRLDAYLKNDRRPASAVESVDVGRVCLNRGLPVAAVRFFREGFVAEPGLLDGANALDAVTAAVWAAFGRGEDALRLPDAERERHRHQAYDWLRAEFRLWQGRANGATEKGQAAIRQAMTQRLLNVDLALLRDEKELAKLPETEQANWRKLWSEIEALRKQVQSKR